LYLETGELCKEALGLLNEKLPQMRLKPDEVSDELYNVVVSGGLVADSGAIYLPRCFEAEDFVAGRVAEMLTERCYSVNIVYSIETEGIINQSLNQNMR
jgi:hypothetical protein